MKIKKTPFKGLLLIQHKNNIDERGSLREIYNAKKLKFSKFVFDYCTFSKKDVLRGFHFQYKFQQAKYVNVIKGKILDCVIDLRKNSKTFGKSFSVMLSEKNALSLFIPKGFAHGYYSMEKTNIIYYRLSEYYHPKYEDGIMWNDKEMKVKWPNKKPLVSKKDKKLKTFSQFLKTYKSL